MTQPGIPSFERSPEETANYNERVEELLATDDTNTDSTLPARFLRPITATDAVRNRRTTVEDLLGADAARELAANEAAARETARRLGHIPVRHFQRGF